MHTELPLESVQNEQLTLIVSTFMQDHLDELKKIFEEGEKHGVGSKLRDIWSLDAKRECSEFKQDQLHNGRISYRAVVWK